jgi:hypothetical protein
MKNTLLFHNYFSSPQKEKRLIHQYQGPQEGPEGTAKGIEQTEQEIPFDFPLKVAGKASELMKEREVSFSEGNRLSIGGQRFRFDENTKSISVYSHKGVLYVEVTNKKGPKDILSVDENGKISLDSGKEKVEKKKEVSLESLIKLSKDRRWMKELAIDSSRANQLLIASKQGLTLEDNYSKSNGFYVMKEGKRIGEVTVFLNDNWQQELSSILNKELSNKERQDSFFLPFGREIRDGDIAVHIPSVKGPDSVFRLNEKSGSYECVNYPGSHPDGVTEKKMQQMLKKYDSIIIKK